MVRLPLVQQGLPGGGEHHEHDAWQAQGGDRALCSPGNFEESEKISGRNNWSWFQDNNFITLHYGLLSSKTILDLVSFLYHIFTKKMGAAGRHTAYMGWKGMVF